VNAFDLEAAFPGFSLDAAASWTATSAALFGASGSGKSTILEAMAGLRPEVSGTVTLRGRAVHGVPPRERRVGWVPQDAALFPHMTARENVAFAARSRGGDAGVARRAIEALEIGGVLDREAPALSGGERQRVAIARAVASGADVLLLDEPLAAIDRPLRGRILPFLARLPERLGVSMLVVSHDPVEVMALATHVVFLVEGRVAAEGDPRGVFESAAALSSLHALGAENVFDVSVVARGEGTTRLLTRNGCEIEMASVPSSPDPVRVALRSEDIVLAAGPPGLVSTQNVLPGAVESVELVGPQCLVTVRAGGEAFVAKVTARAARSLGLAPGKAVTLLVKAHAIVPST